MVEPQLDCTSECARQAVLAAADRWLAHRSDFFSLKDIHLGDPIDWHRDYASGAVSPVRYSGFINTGDTRKVGDIKYTWELNRLQHLVLLALAQTWTGDPRYSAEIERQMISWDESNPFMMGVNWKSPLEAGLRLISWAYVSFLSGELRQNQNSTWNQILQCQVYQHQYFIAKFHSKHSSANNHLIGEMAGLYVASVFWPWYRESASWRSFGRQKLIEEIERQVELDGVGRERATEYQSFAGELFLLAGALGQCVGEPFPERYWDRLSRMLVFLSAISNRRGEVPVFGDGDNGQVVALPESLAARVGALGRIQSSCNRASRSDLRSNLLLWGQSPGTVPLGRDSRATGSVEVFPDGGYCVLAIERGHEDEIVVVFDAGPLGFPPLNAHGHADALSFTLSYGGREFLIDPGTYCYQSSSLWRSYFRGTAAHNTVRIDEQDQSVPGGPFLWLDAAQSQVERVRDAEEFVDVAGSHTGYRRLMDPVIHRRCLRLLKKPKVLVVNDRLECRGAHTVELMFHFSDQCQVRHTGESLYEASNCGKQISIQLDSRFETRLYRGSESPIFGWVSRSFGVKNPSVTLVARAQTKGPTEFLTEIAAH